MKEFECFGQRSVFFFGTIKALRVEEEEEDIKETGYLKLLVRACEPRKVTLLKVMMSYLR